MSEYQKKRESKSNVDRARGGMRGRGKKRVYKQINKVATGNLIKRKQKKKILREKYYHFMYT